MPGPSRRSAWSAALPQPPPISRISNGPPPAGTSRDSASAPIVLLMAYKGFSLEKYFSHSGSFCGANRISSPVASPAKKRFASSTSVRRISTATAAPGSRAASSAATSANSCGRAAPG